MGHNWKKLYLSQGPEAQPWDNFEGCPCGTIRLTKEDGKYTYFYPGWASPSEPDCTLQTEGETLNSPLEHLRRM